MNNDGDALVLANAACGVCEGTGEGGDHFVHCTRCLGTGWRINTRADIAEAIERAAAAAFNAGVEACERRGVLGAELGVSLGDVVAVLSTLKKPVAR